ncbi:AI-2E family transporter [Phytomonospora endophytica]|uniref:Putative PurR-regulated permease PerM n=1 Tax=Phytomonospora endophytica TaxID=714109 RepID=A0A841FLB7_9ACTN|nr:AI-2E family transporter [Phytomonospora endophytica]MBB6034342.1 putative PurR-regulated permease PerM [Phytomonospora endophytica]GIG66735.1 AI-2E family transporter [Phytomonospora endophytica]
MSGDVLPKPEPSGGIDRGLVAAAALVVVVAGMKSAAGIVAPVALALVLVVALSPVQSALIRRGWPWWLSSLVLLLVIYGCFGACVYVLVVSVGRLSDLVPVYTERAQDLITATTTWLAEQGVDADQLQTAVSGLDPNRLVDVFTTVAGSAVSVLSNLLFILGLLLFMGIDAAGFPTRLDRLAPERPALVTALREFARGTRKYLIVATVFGLIVAVLDGLALWALGVPLPLLWALVAFITNYIPNIGFIIGLVPPALLGLLDGGWQTMVWVVVLYSLFNFVIQSVIQPKVTGDSVGLSVTLTFLALVFWAWVIGGLGAILAVPLTLLVKALLVDATPSTRWANHLLAAHPLPDTKD